MPVGRNWRTIAASAMIGLFVVAMFAAPLVFYFNPTTMVLVIRHAEKADVPPNDPVLSQIGQERAQELSRVVGDADITAIFTSQFVRTQETARPLANRLGIAITPIDEDNVDALMDQLLPRHRGEVVLIVSHSPTVPTIIERLGGGIQPVLEAEFDNLYVVAVPAWGSTKVARLKYGR